MVALCIKQELILVVVGGIFVAETLSVLLQIGSVRLRKGKRIFRMAPLHHHFEMMGWAENHVTVRFWIVAVVLALLLIPRADPNLYPTFVDRLLANPTTDTAVTWREKAIGAVFRQIDEAPITGVGFGRTVTFEIAGERVTTAADPHNQFLYLWAGGGLLLLEEQDRSRWDEHEIHTGLSWLARSAEGQAFSRYHAEAGIAAEHCLARAFAETRWDRIAECYALLERLAPSPIHTLNRAVATAEWRGPAAAE